ncbi:MAG: hypothetical protein KA521_07320 [Crocinitomicaceae bacterium]|nr:hypothetical protein [Crocinitomicaceae bacterium]
MNNMNRIKYILLIIIIISLYGCKSEEEINKEIKNCIEVFIQDLKMKNTYKIKKTYPSFTNIGTYWIPNDFNLNNIEKSNDTYNVYGNYKSISPRIEKQVMFSIKIKNDQYIIVESKGLSGYIGTSIYDLFIRLGCISENNTDVEISKYCNKNENYYTGVLDAYIDGIIKEVTVDNKFLKFNNGYFISGKLLITNNSDLVIPENSYNIEIGMINTKNYNINDKQNVLCEKPLILPNQSVFINIDYVPFDNKFNRIGGLFDVSNKEKFGYSFNEFISNTAGWDCDKWEYSLKKSTN